VYSSYSPDTTLLANPSMLHPCVTDIPLLNHITPFFTSRMTTPGIGGVVPGDAWLQSISIGARGANTLGTAGCISRYGIEDGLFRLWRTVRSCSDTTRWMGMRGCVWLRAGDLRESSACKGAVTWPTISETTFRDCGPWRVSTGGSPLLRVVRY